MKRFGFIILLLGLVTLITPSLTHADYTATDNDIAGQLEITPKDPPFAGQNVVIKFIFTDATEKFQLRNCDCQLTITQPGRLPYTQPLTLQNTSGPNVNFTSLPYLFPTSATYAVRLTGKPIDTNVFTPFVLTWEVPVQPTEQTTPPASNVPYANYFFLTGVLLTCGIFGYAAYHYRRKRRRRD